MLVNKDQPGFDGEPEMARTGFFWEVSREPRHPPFVSEFEFSNGRPHETPRPASQLNQSPLAPRVQPNQLSDPTLARGAARVPLAAGALTEFSSGSLVGQRVGPRSVGQLRGTRPRHRPSSRTPSANARASRGSIGRSASGKPPWRNSTRGSEGCKLHGNDPVAGTPDPSMNNSLPSLRQIRSASDFSLAFLIPRSVQPYLWRGRGMAALGARPHFPAMSGGFLKGE